jgi:hypothetical protein
MRTALKLCFFSWLWVGLSSIASTASYTLPSAGDYHGTLNVAPSPVLVVAPSSRKARRFQWKPALRESLEFLAIEHGDRLMQRKTQMQLGGPFFRNWGTSIRNIHGWGDGDPVITNYIAHPMQGAVSGYIQIQNDPQGWDEEFGRSKRYWHSRLKALAWAAVYSTQFEIGPISEATIGHVGLVKGTAGFADLVVTPTAGFGMILLEDVLHRFVLKKLEAKTTSPWKLTAYRIFFNPSRSFAGVLAGRLPWQQPQIPGRASVLSPVSLLYGQHDLPKKIEGWNKLASPGTTPGGKPRRKPNLICFAPFSRQ